jgi:RNA recognition motif-containing protein
MEDVKALFSKFGKVKRIVIMPEGEDKCFVTMSSMLEAYQAFKNIRQAKFCNGKINIEVGFVTEGKTTKA